MSVEASPSPTPYGVELTDMASEAHCDTNKARRAVAIARRASQPADPRAQLLQGHIPAYTAALFARPCWEHGLSYPLVWRCPMGQWVSQAACLHVRPGSDGKEGIGL